MHKVVSVLFFLFFFGVWAKAQILPKEGRKLCYRIIGFSFPAVPGTNSYKIEIAAGIFNDEISFEKSIVTSVSGKKNKIIGEVPSFGAGYTWRSIGISHTGIKTKSSFYHFSTRTTEDVDTNVTRLRIIKNAEKYKDAYVFIDNARAMYDMKGKPVWFLPGTDLVASRNSLPRDLKLSPQGTITFITGGKPYEITYDGNILWYHDDTFNKGKIVFHHEFTRLRNGHYMCMLLKNAIEKLPVFKDSIARNAADSNRFYHNMQFNALAEFDKNNVPVWYWSGYDYINTSDLYGQEISDTALFNINDLHENAFFFDEQNKALYISFKNISRVIKIKYPEGNVLNTYGTLYKPGIAQMGNDLFCGQHSCGRSRKGYLYLFNNNTCSESHIPQILVFQEPPPGENTLKKIWEYQCTIEGADSESIKKIKFNSSGSVSELPDRSMLVMMGAPYPKTFIVSDDKKILWSAMPEKYNSDKKKWEVFPELYRASIITDRKQLERLIWNAEKRK